MVGAGRWRSGKAGWIGFGSSLLLSLLQPWCAVPLYSADVVAETKSETKSSEAPSPSWPLPQHADQGPLPFLRVDWRLADFELISPNLNGLRFRL